jgi:CheY-like chemotaxis protein
MSAIFHLPAFANTPIAPSAKWQGRRTSNSQIALADDLPAFMQTDALRLQQVVNNLLSNAFKFTDVARSACSISRRGKVIVTDAAWPLHKAVPSKLRIPASAISPAHQQVIFEAFQQADGTTSRRYGGTGLGLSISRELASLLGGEIRLESEPGKGSTFVLLLPLHHQPATDRTTPSRRTLDYSSGARTSPSDRLRGEASAALPAEQVADTTSFSSSREMRKEPLILIVENDPSLAETIRQAANEQGFGSTIISEGRNILPLLARNEPDAVIIDLEMPELEGCTLLDLLKHDHRTRHLPIHAIVGATDRIEVGITYGAVGYTAKPVGRAELSAICGGLRSQAEPRDRRLLHVRMTRVPSEAVGMLQEVDSLKIVQASPRQAVDLFAAEKFDCIVITGGSLSAVNGKTAERLLENAGSQGCPAFLEFKQELTHREHEGFQGLGAAIISGADAPGRLLAELSLALQLPMAALPGEGQRLVAQFYRQDSPLRGRTIAIIDDDVRNIFALTAILEQYDAEILYSENGSEGIALVKANPQIGAVLVDIMMPDVDGYEVMRRIRKMKRFKKLPMIAVTAKAMEEDRVKCFEAGASGYLSKPVQPDELLAVLRTQLRQKAHQ